jgi:hypothetical protein
MFKIRSHYFGLLIIVISACNQGKVNQSSLDPQEGIETRVPGMTGGEVKETHDSLRNPYHNAYLTDLTIPEIGSLYLSDSIIPLDNSVTFQLMDTLVTCSPEDRDFYLSVFDVILRKADGALAEAVGSYSLRFIEIHPEYFLDYLSTAEFDIISKWAEYTSYEMYSSIPEDSLAFYSNKLIIRLDDISNEENDGLLHFGRELVSYATSMIED